MYIVIYKGSCRYYMASLKLLSETFFISIRNPDNNIKSLIPLSNPSFCLATERSNYQESHNSPSLN